ncbi:MAG: hypothetical protein JRJ87_06520 [Deltaproteobacteria bacterium]|nr:hypothetical protein [Deltaproteobacteria bacterium]
MGSISIRLSLIVLCIYWLGCSAADKPADAGLDAQDAGADSPGDSYDAGQRPDHDPDSSFLLNVPAGTDLCTHFSAARNWQQELAMLGRIVLKPGHYILPRTAGIYEEEIVEQVVYGPDARVLDPQVTTGEFTASFRNQDGIDTWIYTFTKEFTLDQEPYWVVITIPIAQAGDWPAQVVLDPTFMFDTVNGRATIGPGEDPITEIQDFVTCQLPERGPLFTVGSESGTQLVLDQRYCTEPPEFCAGCTICYSLFAADLTFAGQTRTVRDNFKLVYSAMLHNLNPVLLIMIDPPIGQTAALMVDDNVCYGADLVFLDSNLVELQRETIDSCDQNYR